MELRQISRKMNKKGVTNGLVTGVVVGTALLVVTVLVYLVVTSTLNNSGLLTAGSDEKGAAGNLSANFTSGIHNISSKIPTVFSITAVVLIIAILAFLIMYIRRAQLGGGAGSGNL